MTLWSTRVSLSFAVVNVSKKFSKPCKNLDKGLTKYSSTVRCSNIFFDTVLYLEAKVTQRGEHCFENWPQPGVKPECEFLNVRAGCRFNY